jgi:L-xylulokinase
LGSGVYDCDKYSVISGTWNINSAIEKSLISAGKNTKCSLAADGMSYIYVESSATSAVNLEWFIDNMIKGFGSIGIPDRNLYKRINEGVAGIKPEESEIIYLPFLHSTYLADGINGGFLGVKAGHGVHHILRAVFEGVAFAHLMHLENLQKSGIVRKSAVLSGGASNSDVWCQIFSDVLNMEIISTKSTQAGALGVAASTALGTGIYKSFKEAVNNMVKVKKCYYPGDSNRIYKEKYEKFKEVIVKLSR